MIRPRPDARLLLSLLVAVLLMVPAPRGALAQLPDYAYYYNQGNAYYEKGELSRAIEMYEKALPLAEGQSLPIVYNNLAAIYMRRGNYLLSQLRQYEDALNDFRRAYFLMEYGWPEGMDRTEKQESNRKIAQENVQIGYSNLKIDPGNGKLHLDLAKKLRATGKFQEAIVEYARAVELASQQAEAYKALGDLFNVLNNPEKSKKYYSLAVNRPGAPGGGDDELLVRLASAQNKAGEVDNAVQSLNKALEINPNNAGALKQLEDIWLREIRFNPRSVLGHANLGSVFQKKKLYDQALKAYNTAEQLAGQDPKTTLDVKKLIRLNLGTLYQEMQNYPMAHKAYDTVLQIDPQHTLANYYKAVIYRDTGRVDEAIRQYNQVLSLDPNFEEAHTALLALIRKKPPGQVEMVLKDYADRYPANPVVQSKVGEEFHALKRYEEAISYYRRAIGLQPDLAAAHANLGAALQTMGRSAEAGAYFKKALALDPNNQTVASLAKEAEAAAGQDSFRKALELQQQGDLEGAVRLYQQALGVPGNDTADLRASYGTALQNLSRFNEAVAQYGKAIALDPENGNYHYYLATAYHQNTDLPKATAEYRQALRLPSTEATLRRQAEEALQALDQADVVAWLNQAVEAYGRKAYPQALGLIQNVLGKDPENATAYYYRALIYNDQGKLPQSVTSYQEALRHDPGFKDAYYGLGIVLDKKQDRPGAKNAFQKFLELSNGQEDDFVKYARERIKTP